ncbi:MAG: PKD domain-containing protein, partial [Pyrinomonadaceae bacterium]
PTRLLTSAQQAGTVNVRPRVASAQSGMPEVKATVNRNKVPVGEEVTFTLSPARIVTDPRYRVTLFFGDGKRQVMRQAKITHPYPKAGTYTYSILVEAEKQPTPTPTQTATTPTVSLTATPETVEVNRSVNFSAQLSRRYPNIKYRFVFADGSDSGWQDSSNATHSYRSPNTYKAYVDIGLYANGSTKQLGGSPRQAIKVTESRPVTRVELSATPTSVESGKPVTFNARLNPQSANARYRFDFGDKSPATNWQTSSQTTHRYKLDGKYSARVEVRRATPNSSPISDSIAIQVSNAPDEKVTVDLKVVPGSVLVGVPVFFEAVPSDANASARYRFSFGDGSATTEWSSSPYQTRSYSAAGRYSAFVEMAESGDEPSAASGKKSVRITAIPTNNINDNQNNQNDNRNNNQNGNPNSNNTPRPNVNTSPHNNGNSNSTPVVPLREQTEPNDWWKYLIILIVLLLAGYQAYSYFFAPRPTFVPHVDTGDANVGADNPLAINMQMDVDPNVAGGEFTIDTEGDSLIKSKRIE